MSLRDIFAFPISGHRFKVASRQFARIVPIAFFTDEFNVPAGVLYRVVKHFLPIHHSPRQMLPTAP